MGKGTELTVQQKREAVLALLRHEEPVAVLVRRYGICEATLYRWRDEFLSAGESALASGKGKADGRDRQIQDLQKQLEERDRVIGELTIANRILKKHSEGLY